MGPSASRPISISSASLISMNWRWPVAGFTAHPVVVHSAEVSKAAPSARSWTRFRARFWILVMSFFPCLRTSSLE